MTHQLVLQFKGESLADFDSLVAVENALISELGNSAKVDGHDFGSGTANIFIFTSEPEMTFWRAKQWLQKVGRLGAVTAAHRPVDGDDYSVIWPKDSKAPFSIF
jgi:hypothetical protein